jgi:hypothetical protein
MSHNYLLDTYTYINKRLHEAHQQALAAGDDQRVSQNAAGRMEALSQFERYLGDNFDHKLPRRLARQRARNAG